MSTALDGEARRWARGKRDVLGRKRARRDTPSRKPTVSVEEWRQNGWVEAGPVRSDRASDSRRFSLLTQREQQLWSVASRSGGLWHGSAPHCRGRRRRNALKDDMVRAVALPIIVEEQEQRGRRRAKTIDERSPFHQRGEASTEETRRKPVGNPSVTSRCIERWR